MREAPHADTSEQLPCKKSGTCSASCYIWPSWPRRPRDNEQILRAKSVAQQILDTH